jgi:hypothetical protein
MHMEDLTVMFSGRHWHKPFKTLWRERAKHGAGVVGPAGHPGLIQFTGQSE